MGRTARRHGGSLAAIAKATPAAKKLMQLRKRESERQARLADEVNGWFEKFDANGDGKLQRDELRELLRFLHPSRPPNEENLDYLLERATAIEAHSMRLPGNKHGAVMWRDARQTVLWYGDYCKDQHYIDKIFQKFDTDASGTLEAVELRQVLEAVAPEGCAVDEADVAYVLEQFDDNADGVIDRDELLPMLAKWSNIAYDKLEQQRAQAARIERNWLALKSTVIDPAADAVQGAGQKLLALAQIAKAQRKAEVQSKWQHAADSAAPGSPGAKGNKMMRLVQAAKAQQALEEEAALLVSPAPSPDDKQPTSRSACATPTSMPEISASSSMMSASSSMMSLRVIELDADGRPPPVSTSPVRDESFSVRGQTRLMVALLLLLLWPWLSWLLLVV